MSVKVAVRTRPMSENELKANAEVIVRMNGNEVSVVESLEGFGGKFAYDSALWSTGQRVEDSVNAEASQEYVYNAIGTDLLDHIITGYNGCIFAYGQTGSGKTYCMMGSNEDAGLIPRIAHDLFARCAELRNQDMEVCVEVSYYEIYNEKVRCLLRPTEGGYEDTRLRVREHPKFGPFIEGLAKFVVSTQTEFLKLMRDGNKVRTTASTAMNATSSRSHAVFAITLTQKHKKGSLVTQKTSRLNLVDLAGSERASKTMATGKRLAEGSNINKSLTCLGNVISALAEAEETGKSRYIPYRDSTLTWILKDNLGGNSKTVMLATISPSSLQYDETMGTLRYAERAKKIVNKAVVNETNNNELIAALQKEITALRHQLAAASANERGRLLEELEASEAIKKELTSSLEEKLTDTKRLMAEREAYMRDLEAKLSAQSEEIEKLRSANEEKERRIDELLHRIQQLAASGTVPDTEKVEQMREQVAALEQEQNATETHMKEAQGSVDETDNEDEDENGPSPFSADRAGSTAPVAPGSPAASPAPATVSAQPSSLSVFPLERASLENAEMPLAVRAAMQQRGRAPSALLPDLDSDIFEEVADKDLVLPSRAESADEDLILEEQLANESLQAAHEHEHEPSLTHADSDLDALLVDDSDLHVPADSQGRQEAGQLPSADTSLVLDLPSSAGVPTPPPPPTPPADAKTETARPSTPPPPQLQQPATATSPVHVDATESAVTAPKGESCDAPSMQVRRPPSPPCPAPVPPPSPPRKSTATPTTLSTIAEVPASSVPPQPAAVSQSAPLSAPPTAAKIERSPQTSPIDSPLADSLNLSHENAQGATITETQVALEGFFTRSCERPEIYAPNDRTAQLVIPSHALPNNRFLCEPFHVTKMKKATLLGHKKDRIWEIGMLRGCFSNLDTAGVKSFDVPAVNLFRVEKSATHSRRLALYFFDVPHPYELEFTSTARRQQFFELATLLRRNSILWCPSLCLDGENDVTITVKGTTVDRPGQANIPVSGEVKMTVARMPYEVIDLWYGCFSLESKSLPRSTAVFSGFFPKEQREVYVIGVTDVPAELLGSDELGRYFLAYLGTSSYFVLANTTLSSKEHHTNNAIVVLCKRSFIVRVANIELLEAVSIRRDGIHRGDFTAAGCALRINESSIGIILVNAKAGKYPLATRAACIRSLLASFPFVDPSVDVSVRFDYFIVSGAFHFGGDFCADDALIREILADNLMSNMREMEPSASLRSSVAPLRIFYSVRPNVSRMDVSTYATSRALGFANTFIAADLFCQRSFLSLFGEAVPCVQVRLDRVTISGARLPRIADAELQLSMDAIEDSPVSYRLAKRDGDYVIPTSAEPCLYPCVSNAEYLRLQTLTFSLLGSVGPVEAHKRIVVASGVFPLKAVALAEPALLHIPLYYRGCTVGKLTAVLLHVYYETNSAEISAMGFHDARYATLLSCYENQVRRANGVWEAALPDTDSVYAWSADDPTREKNRELFVLPDAQTWRWLTEWQHDQRVDDAQGWVYAEGVDGELQLSATATTSIRRRRWSRVMQATGAIVYHAYLAQKRNIVV